MRHLNIFFRVIFSLSFCPVVQAAQEAELTEQQHIKADTIGGIIRCPVCQGMPIADSPATMAVEMMQVVREKVVAGNSEKEILLSTLRIIS